VLQGDGINCEMETQFALGEAGFDASLINVSTLFAEPQMLNRFQMLVLPGGFAFGDEIASGKVLALKLQARLDELLRNFIDRGSLVLGICNGFQVLVQLGVLPATEKRQSHVASLAHNLPNRFIDRWVAMRVSNKVDCCFLKGLERLELPIRHGEGRLCVEADQRMAVKSLACLFFEEDVNGSFEQIAGLTNRRGNVLGLMPHPEAFIRLTQHPAWTSMKEGAVLPGAKGGRQATLVRAKRSIPDGLQIFQNARMALET